MLPLRYPLVWLLLGWLLVVAVATGSLIPGAVVTGFSSADKIAHATSYFFLMIWFAGLYTRQRYLIIALTLVSLGIVLEFVQARLPYRAFDPLDLVANLFGVVAGLGLSFAFLSGWCQRAERLLGFHD